MCPEAIGNGISREKEDFWHFGSGGLETQEKLPGSFIKQLLRVLPRRVEQEFGSLSGF